MSLLASHPDGLLVIDEAQRAPGLVLPLKANVDKDRRPGRFLRTGSADLLRVKGVTDPLAGRAETVEMLPLSQGELLRRGEPEDFITQVLTGPLAGPWGRLAPDTVLRGGMPEVQHRSGDRARRWLTAYVERLADHDARELHGGDDSARLHDWLHVLPIPALWEH